MRSWEEVSRAAAESALVPVMSQAGPGMDEASQAVCRQFAARQVEAAGIFGRKQVAYGCGNVVEVGGAGLVGRIREKLCRIERVVAGAPDGGEPVRIEALDVLNLAGILCMVLDGAWPGASWKGTQQSEVEILRAKVALLKAQVSTFTTSTGPDVSVSPV